jgi:hypothetical protein
LGEIFPGFLIWGTFFLSLVLSFWQPLFMVYAIIVFDIYWVFRVI